MRFTIVTKMVCVGFCFGVLVIFNGCGQEHKQNQNTSDEGIEVVATFYPVAYFAQEIVGDHGHVTNLVGGQDVHSYTPSPHDLMMVHRADVFLYHNANLEIWADEMIHTLPQNVVVSQVTENIPLRAVSAQHTHEHAHTEHTHESTHAEHTHEHTHAEHAKKHHHDHGGYDPHVWLDPVLAQDMVDAIAHSIIAADPENAADYTHNADYLIQRLQQLDAQYRENLADCRAKEAIVSHDAFGYIGDRYGLTFHAIAGLSTNDTPSAEKLAELKNEAHDGVRAVLVEKNRVQKYADIIATETGLQTLPIVALGSGTGDAQKTYFDIMEENLHVFVQAFNCTNSAR